MAIEVIMPKVDMDQETGTVVEWIKTSGQPVEQGEIILVIETDKVAIDVEAPGTGILEGISAHSGDVVPIGTVIAYILEEGEELPAGSADRDEEDGAPSSRPSVEPAAPPDQVPATPIARKMAQSHQLDLTSMAPTGKGGRVTKADVQAALDAAKMSADPGKIVATPAARRAARLKGVDLSLVEGTGPGGRVQAFDVENYRLQAGAPKAGAVQRGDQIPLIGIRRTIAERMTASYQSIPHIQLTVRVELLEFNKIREEYNQKALKRGGDKLSVTAMLVKLVAQVLARNPLLNSSLVDEQIQVHQDINIGIAVALEEGLIVPVIKHADRKRIGELAAETRDLAARAREDALDTRDVKGGTFTITNLGPFGIEQFNAIINAPEAAILAVGTTTQEVVAQPDGAIAVRPVMRMTLSADHRLIDGAVAARFLADLKKAIEQPTLTP